MLHGTAPTFISESIGLFEFRQTFDHKTRNEWDFFGLKGLSGAMFLNKLAKHLPDQDAIATEIRTAVTVPPSDIAARDQLDRFMTYLHEQIEHGVATASDLQPNRAPFLVSACWHIQAPDDWPIIFQSARKALQQDGLIRRHANAEDRYIEFAQVFRELSTRLPLTLWDLEHLCSRISSRIVSIDDSPVPEEQDEAPQIGRVWLIAPGRRADHFDQFYSEGTVAINWNQLGDLSNYADLDEVRQALQRHRGDNTNPFQDALACYQFAHMMEVGDVVFAKRGRTEIVGYGIVTSPYRYEPQRGTFTHVRSIEWKLRGEWVVRDRPLVTKTLTEIGKYPQLVAEIRNALKIDDPIASRPESTLTPISSYSLDDAEQELFMSREAIQEALELLRYKKNLVLQGPPGVGKTFFAKRLANLLLGEIDPDRFAQVQFHQSYAYEDFIQGYRPVDGGTFGRVDGPFLRFCDRALQDPDSPYVLLIDEINRGNLGKIFGELLLLIEGDKRSDAWATTLTYSKADEEPFYVPSNLHIIGTMNTADRSLAMVDYALRRRFVFFEIHPGFDQPAFAKQLANIGVDRTLRDRIVARLARLNKQICDDRNLGPGFSIGHSYFCHAGSDGGNTWYQRIVRTEIKPLLREYWFDDTGRADQEVARLLDAD